jgi:hypothetical protein
MPTVRVSPHALPNGHLHLFCKFPALTVAESRLQPGFSRLCPDDHDHDLDRRVRAPLLPAADPCLRLFAGGFRKLCWRLLSVIPLVVVSAVTWARVSLPVVIFAAIARSSVVATFVALRALFGPKLTPLLTPNSAWQLPMWGTLLSG